MTVSFIDIGQKVQICVCSFHSQGSFGISWDGAVLGPATRPYLQSQDNEAGAGADGELWKCGLPALLLS